MVNQFNPGFNPTQPPPVGPFVQAILADRARKDRARQDAILNFQRTGTAALGQFARSKERADARGADELEGATRRNALERARADRLEAADVADLRTRQRDTRLFKQKQELADVADLKSRVQERQKQQRQIETEQRKEDRTRIGRRKDFIEQAPERAAKESRARGAANLAERKFAESTRQFNTLTAKREKAAENNAVRAKIKAATTKGAKAAAAQQGQRLRALRSDLTREENRLKALGKSLLSDEAIAERSRVIETKIAQIIFERNEIIDTLPINPADLAAPELGGSRVGDRAVTDAFREQAND